MEENTPPKVTAKQRVLEAQGKEVPVDLFLYSCLERERLIRATKGTNATIVEWPVLSGNVDDDVKSLPFGTVLGRMVGWYRDHLPAMKDRRPLDHEMLSEVIPGIVGLNHDLDRLYRLRTNASIPDFDGVTSNEVWDEITKAIQDNFPGYAKFFLQYVQWSHGVEKVEHFEPGSRPPVGKYAPPPLRKDGDRGGRFGGDRGGRGGDRDRGPRSGGDRGGRSGGSDRPPRPEFGGGDRGPRPDRPDRGPRPDRQDRQDRGPRPERDDRPARGPRGDFGGDRGPRRGPNDENTAKLTEIAMAEVDQAIDRLRQDTSVDEVTLKPTNSFYRRIQHQKIVDAGFHSFSVGEGPDRAVKVARKGDA